MRSTEAADALRDIVNAHSHVVRHMPAYDLTGELIDPLRYSNKLIGATVIVRFTLQHFVIKKKKDGHQVTNNVFTGTIDHLHIAINPDWKSPVTPRKKKPGKMDTVYGNWSPTKRRHDGEGEGDQDQNIAGRKLRKRAKNQGSSAAGPSTNKKT